MNAGSAFCIGKTHKVCQDYAHHGNEKFPYVIVSDGCSGSPFTDIGSRILTRVVTDSFLAGGDPDHKEIINEANEIRRLMCLPPESLDATLIWAYVRNGKYKISLFGDGVFVKTSKDGKMQVVRVEYPSGAPLYLNYSLDSTRMKGYKNMFTLLRRVYTYTLSTDGSIANLVTTEDSDGELDFCDEWDYDDLTSISLMSDGLFSFYELQSTATSKSESAVEPNDVLRKLLDFKGFQGDFVARRMQRFHKDCEKWNWFHADDLSLATIYLGNENAQNN